MPIVDVVHDGTLSGRTLERLRDALVAVVPEAVECDEEPRVGPLQPGDLDVRFRVRGPLDVGGLPVCVEVRTKRLAGRVDDVQRRADLVRDRLAGLGAGDVGVWLVLVDGAWSQT